MERADRKAQDPSRDPVRAAGRAPAATDGWHDSPRMVAQRQRLDRLFGASASPVVQRVVSTAEPHTAAWHLPDYKLWLSGRPVHAHALALPHPPVANPDLTEMAQHQLALLDAAPLPAHHFATLDLLHADLQARTRAVVTDLLSPGVGVRPDDLDVAAAMYSRLHDYHGEEAVLHKLDWHDVHERQYHNQGVDAHAASTSGRIYGPWRAGPGRVPDDGTTGGAENVHTMPLNVAWLLACCHHGVLLRLFVPLTERALYRNPDAGMVVGPNGQQRKLSALGRELMALLATGLYRVARVDHDPLAPQGFEDSVLLEPTAEAAHATATQLTVPSNLALADVRTALLQTAGIPTPDEAVVGTTVEAAKVTGQYEALVRETYQGGPAALGAYARGRLRTAEDGLVRVTRETYPAMRRRVLGGEQPRVPVRFRCHYATQPGQDLAVVGDLPALGQWDPNQARPMAWTAGHVWTLDQLLPDAQAGQPVQYKYVLRDHGAPAWEPGNNHQRTLPEIRMATPTYTDNWGQG